MSFKRLYPKVSLFLNENHRNKTCTGFTLIETTVVIGILSLLLSITTLSFHSIKTHELNAQKAYISQQLHTAKTIAYQTQSDQLIPESQESSKMIGYNMYGRTKFSGTAKKENIPLVSLGIGIGKITIK